MWKKWKIWTRDIKKSMLRAFARSRAKKMMKNGLEFFILKSNEHYQSYCFPVSPQITVFQNGKSDMMTVFDI